jgi:hypothetical protein
LRSKAALRPKPECRFWIFGAFCILFCYARYGLAIAYIHSTELPDSAISGNAACCQ